jgi:hypothetical protein
MTLSLPAAASVNRVAFSKSQQSIDRIDRTVHAA